MQVIYKDFIGGKWEYFTYSDGVKIFLSAAYVGRERLKSNNGIKIINISKI